MLICLFHHNLADAMDDTVFIHDFAVTTLIGILPHERVRKQKLILDLTLTTDFTQAAASDDVRDALNYAEIADAVADFAAQAEYNLLERFAQQLIDRLFAKFPASSIELRISKPGAIEYTRNVGIRLQRQRPSEG